MTTQTDVKSKPAVQLALGSQAIKFNLPVTVTKLDGTQANLTLQCKALRKTEWAKAKDAHQQVMLGRAAAGEAPTADFAEFLRTNSLQTIVEHGLDGDVALVLKFATGWDLDAPFDAPSLSQLEDEFGGSIGQIVSLYDAAVFRGRLGN